MTVICVDDVRLHADDPSVGRIVEVYAKHPPFYAVYGTPRRVLVQYADDPELARAQRAALAPLNPLRGVINGLVDGWGPARSKRFTRGVADALIVALEGDTASATAILQAVRQDIIDERTSWARFLYLIVALCAATMVMLAAVGAHSAWFSNLISLPSDAAGIWQAGRGGAVGAFFSIATAIRGRTVLTDFQWLDNASDATLRIVIGAIAAMLLYCMLQANLVNMTFGAIGLSPIAHQQWMFVTVIGFTAGFVERLVPDLLDKSTLRGAAAQRLGGTAPIRPGAPETPRISAAPVALLPSREAGDGPEHEGDDHLCGEGIAPAEATPDDALPPAIGGVAALA